jgi:hypothetical protein
MKGAFHLDHIGKRPPGEYFTWTVDLSILELYFWEQRYQLYYGWGQNWKQVLALAEQYNIKVFTYLPELEAYRERVEAYRSSPEYQRVEKKLYDLSDKPVDWYVRKYAKFVEALSDYNLPEWKP